MAGIKPFIGGSAIAPVRAVSSTLTIIAVVASVAQLGIGLAVGIYFRKPQPRAALAGRTQRDVPVATAQPQSATSAEAVPAEPDAATEEMRREVIAGLQQVTESIQDYVVDHASRVEEINQQLLVASAREDNDDEVQRLVGELLAANLKLKDDLKQAQTLLQQQDVELESRRREARTDGLTGLANRREFDEQLARRISEWWRRKTPVSLLVIDVDHFKRFNDTYGHQAGDQVLAGVAGVLHDTLRDMDFVARYGGEEFVAILPSTVLHEARRAAQRVIDAINATTFHFHDVQMQVTVSVGVAQAMEGEDGPAAVKRADEGVYAAKGAGRNCGYFHNGTMCLPLNAPNAEAVGIVQEPQDERRISPRRGFNVRQGVAPYYGGDVPERQEFRMVDCLDISIAGLGYASAERPSSPAVVVALGAAPKLTYMTAEVVYSTTSAGVNGGTFYRVGCRFTGRIKSADDRHDA